MKNNSQGYQIQCRWAFHPFQAIPLANPEEHNLMQGPKNRTLPHQYEDPNL